VFNPFRWFDKLIKWFSEGISIKAKILISLFFLFFLIGIGFTGYKIETYFKEDPEACRLCHVHPGVHDLWAQSVHFGVVCAECHHATIKERAEKLYKFAILGYREVKPRQPGKIIVRSQLCMSCHWEHNPKYPQAANVRGSRYHALHVFMEGLACAQCHGHGDLAHQFLPEERFCLKCHPGKEVHGTGMQKLACINCHTDRTADLRPDRLKCLFCHSADDSIRKKLIEEGTIDVKYFHPSPEILKKATKVDAPPKSPMQFYCFECHHPHDLARPAWNDCMRCHQNVEKTGAHPLHIQGFGMQCKDCHKPHEWRVTEAQARGKDCLKCHEYKNPEDFIR
jgi:nitrate/TMAO reductase-like tetraheme cytochrome c subunit